MLLNKLIRTNTSNSFSELSDPYSSKTKQSSLGLEENASVPGVSGFQHYLDECILKLGENFTPSNVIVKVRKGLQVAFKHSVVDKYGCTAVLKKDGFHIQVDEGVLKKRQQERLMLSRQSKTRARDKQRKQEQMRSPRLARAIERQNTPSSKTTTTKKRKKRSNSNAAAAAAAAAGNVAANSGPTFMHTEVLLGGKAPKTYTQELCIDEHKKRVAARCHWCNREDSTLVFCGGCQQTVFCAEGLCMKRAMPTHLLSCDAIAALPRVTESQTDSLLDPVDEKAYQNIKRLRLECNALEKSTRKNSMHLINLPGQCQCGANLAANAKRCMACARCVKCDTLGIMYKDCPSCGTCDDIMTPKRK